MSTTNRRRAVGGLLTTMALVVAALITGSPGSPASATSNTEPSSGFYSLINFNTSYEGFEGSRLGRAPIRGSDGSFQYGPACEATNDKECQVSALDVDPKLMSTNQIRGFNSFGTIGLVWTSVFPYCGGATQMNCVAGLTIKDATTGVIEEGRFTGQSTVPDSPSYSYRSFRENMGRLIPNGGLAPVFSASLFSPSSVTTTSFAGPAVPLPIPKYRVRVSMSGQSKQASCILPKEKRTEYCNSKWPDVRTNFVQQFTMKVERVFGFPDQRGIADYRPVGSLPKDAEFSVRLRLSPQLLPKGWLIGRVGKPGINQKAIVGGFEIDVSGAVAQAPSTAVYLTCADLMANETVKKYLDKAWSRSRSTNGLTPIGTCHDDASISLTQESGYGFNPKVDRDVLLGKEVAGDGWGINDALDVFKAANDAVGVLRTEWSLNWTPEEWPWELTTTNSACNSIGLVGVLGSTASLYGEVPTFDPTSGQLTYQMVGPHYLADGTLNTATMSMVMRRDYAMCQWGIDPAPDTMLVNIVNSNSSVGNPAIISSTVEGDFFRVDASGITFSAPQMGIAAKVGKLKATKSLSLKKGSSLPITKVMKTRKGYVASWYVKKGLCRITKRDTKTLRMAKKGTCEILITEFNKKSRTAKRTLLKLS